MKLSIVVAMSENRVIGRGGALPWHISEDLKRFRRLTEGHAVVMGRKTHESIGKLLPNRENVILTRQTDYHVDGAKVFGDLDAALTYLKDRDEVFIIGGGEIYAQALPRVDCIHLTLVHEQVEGDTYFPDWSDQTFVERDRESHTQPQPFSFITLMRSA